jgi:UDP-N-acetylmuramoyl-tripeptide--D-alanyl-D-alanine ligase
MTIHQLKLTCGFVRDALRGKSKTISTKFDESRVVHKVSTDSRKVGPGDLFVALKGESFDGHEFIAQAVEKGAIAVICEKYPAAAPQEGVDIFLVENSLESFRLMARHWRELIDPTVVAVAGSVGKTTTKDMLAAILSAKFQHIVWTKGSENGFVGLPMTLMAIDRDTEAAVIEVGIDAPGAMIQHIDLVRPEIALVTAISEEHLEWLKDLETIAREENLILEETARAGGASVINLDDPWIKPLFHSIRSHRKVGFTLGGVAGPQTVAGRLVGHVLTIEGLGREIFSVTCPLPGEHNARNLLGAIAVAMTLGVTPDQIEEGLSTFAGSGGRSQLEILPGGSHVLCDFYNANPASMRAAFRVAKDIRRDRGCLWLCLGDMKELGAHEEALHRDLAKDIRDLGPNVKVLLLGQRMRWLGSELRQVAPQIPVREFDQIESLASELKMNLSNQDFVLIKGSRSMRMEALWHCLKQHV